VIIKEDVEHELARIIEIVSGNDPGLDVAADTSLQEELGIDSLSLVELAEEIEERYGVRVPDEDLDGLRTFGDLVDYLRTRA
jgi:acyl carrier protein